MLLAYSMMLLALGVATVAEEAPSSCADAVRATAKASRLADLPPEIRNDLARISLGEMADSGTPMLQTDAPSASEANLPTGRFIEALLVKDTWFVSFEVSMSTPTTIGYTRTQRGDYFRSPSHYFAGPPCEAIKAALKGVRSPGGFNF